LDLLVQSSDGSLHFFSVMSDSRLKIFALLRDGRLQFLYLAMLFDSPNQGHYNPIAARRLIFAMLNV
jgi:hypothetical protein